MHTLPNAALRRNSSFPGTHSHSTAARSVYSGRDRLGSYRRFGDRWLAVDRLGRPLGQFDTELEAQAAISKAVPAVNAPVPVTTSTATSTTAPGGALRPSAPTPTGHRCYASASALTSLGSSAGRPPLSKWMADTSEDRL